MRFEDFLNAIESAGWQATGDAQHYQIRRVWEKLYPVIAELEKELLMLSAF